MTLQFGALDPWMDGDVQEVMVTGDGTVWTEENGAIRRAGSLTPLQVSQSIERVTRFSGRRVDLNSPVVDLQLPDGSRACIVLPPVAVDGPTLCIRRFARDVLPLGAFAGLEDVRRLRSLVTGRANIVVSGATSSGKTSLLNSLARCVPVRERIVLIEDTTELRLEHPHVVRLQTRPPGAEGTGEMTAQHLVRASMRLRPDRLVVGEVRGGEVVDMLLALTSGHDGCLTTIHARSAADALDRMTTLALRDHSQFAASTVDALVRSAIDAVVHVRRGADGSRRVTEILGVDGA